jgi:Sialic acid synthase
VAISDYKRLAQLQRFQFTREEFRGLRDFAENNGLVFFSTPFDIESAIFLDDLQPLFKISSGDNTFFPLIEAVADFQKPTLISTGLADLVLLDRIHQMWKEKSGGAELAFLHCVASYPVPLDEANLGAIATLRARYPDLTIGYSDHTVGIETAALAVAAGAKIIEKHFTLDKGLSEFRDHHLSADPVEMTLLVETVRRISRIVGSGAKEPQECERGAREALRRSLAASGDLAIGAEISPQDIQWLRPGTGVAVGDEESVLGKNCWCPFGGES